jgi:hypothetical protein
VEGASASDLLIFLVVLSLRLLVPLGIPRYPLPAILVAFLLDGLDQTIFQQFTNLNLDFYQGYDKALDIYYLVLAYISTLRNWANLFAFQVSRFLIYYRLVGVVLFELTDLRPILLIFPNTFEYFFDYYEAVRLRWDPGRLSRNHVIWAAAFIWIVIKLPQEYIIHVAQVDTTDWIKNNIFGVAATASWGEAFANRPGVTLAIVLAIVALIFGARWLFTHRLPPTDHPLRLAADPIPAGVAARSEEIVAAPGPFRLTDPAVVEKIALVSLVAVVYAQVLPGVQAGVLSVVLGVIFVIVANAALSTWLTRFGLTRVSSLRQFFALALVNAALIVLYAVLLPGRGGSISLGNTLFFALLMTLIVTLFDRYRPIHAARFEQKGRAD